MRFFAFLLKCNGEGCPEFAILIKSYIVFLMAEVTEKILIISVAEPWFEADEGCTSGLRPYSEEREPGEIEPYGLIALC